MDSQMTRPHGPPYEQETHNAELQAGGEDHEGKKSVLRKVKAKAKKIKDTLVHGHGHNHDLDEDHLRHVPDDHDIDQDDDNDEDEEVLDDPEIRGTPVAFGSSAVSNTRVPGQIERLDDPESYCGKPTAMKDEYYGHSQARVNDSLERFTPGKEEDKGLKVDVGKTSNIKEVPFSPLNTPASTTPAIAEQTKVTDPIGTFTREQETIRGQPELNLERQKQLEEDPHAPKDRPEDYDPSNYQTKVTDPTGAGGEEVGITPILRSMDKMKISSDQPELRAGENLPSRQQYDQSIFPTGSHDQFSSEPTPPIPITPQESSRSISKTSEVDTSKFQDHAHHDEASKQGTYTEKISSATSAIADKAISAKNVVASKLGYNEENNAKGHEMREGEEQHKAKPTSSPVEYGKKIAATVTGKLAPAYEKVAETSHTMMSKVPGIRGKSEHEGEANVKVQDKGVSVKDYFADKLRPGDEDRALSEVISESLYKKKQEPDKSGKPIGKVTKSDEDKRRLGSYEKHSEDSVDESSVRIPGGVMVDKIKETVGSLFGKGSQQPQSPGFFTDSATHSTSTSKEETGNKRLQESRN